MSVSVVGAKSSVPRVPWMEMDMKPGSTENAHERTTPPPRQCRVHAPQKPYIYRMPTNRLHCLAVIMATASCIAPKEGATGDVSPAQPRTQRHHFAKEYTDEELRMRTLKTWNEFYDQDLSEYGISREYAESLRREEEVEALGGVYQDPSGMIHAIFFDGDAKVEVDYFPNGKLSSYSRSVPSIGYELFEASSVTGRWNSYVVVKYTSSGKSKVSYIDANNDGIFEHQERIETDRHSRTTRTEVTSFSPNASGDWDRKATTRIENFPPLLQEDAHGAVCPGVRMEADAWIERTLSPPVPVHGCQDNHAVWNIVNADKTRHGPRIELDPASGAHAVSPNALSQIAGRVYIITESGTQGLACGLSEQKRIKKEFALMKAAMKRTLQHFNKSRYKEVLNSFQAQEQEHPIYISCHARIPGKPTKTWPEGEYGPVGSSCYYGVTLNSVEFIRGSVDTGVNAIMMAFNMLRISDHQSSADDYRLRMTMAHEFMHVIGLPGHSSPVDVLDTINSCARAIFCTGYGELSGEESRDNKHRWITRDAAMCAGMKFDERILTNFEVRDTSGSGVCRSGTCSKGGCAALEYRYCDQPFASAVPAHNYRGAPPPYSGTRIHPRAHPAMQCGYCDGLGGFGWENPGVPGPITFRQLRGVKTSFGPPFTLNRCERLPEYCWSPIINREPWVPGWESLGSGSG